VILEDLHLADKPSLLLLEFVVREMSNSRLMIVGNYRDMDLNRRHPLAVTLGELTREHGMDPPDSLVNVVHTQTEGSPLFVSETVRLLIQEGDITFGEEPKNKTASWDIRIPEGVREVIGRRLDRLSDQCNEVLIIAAVVGRQFRMEILQRLIEDLTEDRLLDLLDEALAAHIIEELADDIGLYQFTHALMRETLTSELSANRTVRMHANIAEALEAYYGDAALDHAAVLVEHFSEAEVVLGSQKLLTYSVAAGNAALAALAREQAQQYFERALSALDSNFDVSTRAEIIFGLGRSQTSSAGADQMGATAQTLLEAFQLYQSIGDTASALRVASFPLTSLNTTERIHPLVDALATTTDESPFIEALQNAESGTSEAARLGFLQASFTFHRSPGLDETLLILGNALNDAVAANDVSTDIRIHSFMATADFAYQRTDAGLHHLENALALEKTANEPRIACGLHRWLAEIYRSIGEIDTSRQHADTFLERAEQLHDRNFISVALRTN
jgi:tetratricopeptide (TPR) repeat protein